MAIVPIGLTVRSPDNVTGLVGMAAAQAPFAISVPLAVMSWPFKLYAQLEKMTGVLASMTERPTGAAP